MLCGAFEELFGALGTPQAEEGNRVETVRGQVAALADLDVLRERGQLLISVEAVELVHGLIDG